MAASRARKARSGHGLAWTGLVWPGQAWPGMDWPGMALGSVSQVGKSCGKQLVKSLGSVLYNIESIFNDPKTLNQS